MLARDCNDADAPADRSLRCLLRREGWAILVIFLATAGIEVGVYAAARLSGASLVDATMASLASAAAITALAGPVLAAGARSAFVATLRAAAVADASGIALIVLVFAAQDRRTGAGCVGLVAAVEIYCTLAMVALAGAAVARCGRSSAARNVLGVATAAVFFAMLASPFWTGGLLTLGAPGARRAIVYAATYCNPFYSITAAVAQRTGFVWHLSGQMYEKFTRIGDYASVPDLPWYAAAVVYACIAAIACAANSLIPPSAKDRRR